MNPFSTLTALIQYRLQVKIFTTNRSLGRQKRSGITMGGTIIFTGFEMVPIKMCCQCERMMKKGLVKLNAGW